MNARRSPLFARQLRRAAAQRGRLEPLYRDLSDHWTLILQRLYPVWALVGPGLSDPGHIELHSRQIYLDSEALLGPRQRIAAGRLEPRAVLRCMGVALHETMHAKHTKRWALERDVELAASDDPAERQLAADRKLLEEPRMEAQGVREFAPATVRGRFVRGALAAAVADVIAPAFAAQVALAAAAGLPLSRDLAARASVYLAARRHYGIVEEATLAPLRQVWRQTLGEGDLAALDELYARLVWIPDGELDQLDQAARRYRQIVGPADPPPATAGGGGGSGSAADGEADAGQRGKSEGEGDRARHGERDGEGDEDETGAEPSTGSLGEALERALAAARDSQAEQLDADVELGEVLRDAGERRPRGARGRGGGTGLPGGRLPDRGVDRPPFPDEVQQARRYATRLRQALAHGTRQIDKRTPGGRFDGRAYARGQAQRASGRPVTTHPWRIVRQLRAPLEQPHVGLIVDSSRSMGALEGALGPLCWIVSEGLRQIDGRCAIALFGDGCQLLTDGGAPLARVPGIRTGGGTAFAGDAIELVSDRLEMTNPRRPRFLYVLSDGGWADTRASVARVRWLAEQGVPTVHLSLGSAPLSVECDRVCVLDDAAQALDQIAADTVAALRAAAGKRR